MAENGAEVLCGAFMVYRLREMRFCHIEANLRPCPVKIRRRDP